MVFAVIITVLLFFGSCKKESSVADDPDIYYNKVSRTITGLPGATSLDSIDINADGIYELQIRLNNYGGDTGYVTLDNTRQNIEFNINGGISALYVCTVFTSGQIPPLSGVTYKQNVLPSVKVSGYREGVLNGEGYLAFRFTTGSKYNYGWMRVSVNSSMTEFKILEYAYCNVTDKAIAIGAK